MIPERYSATTYALFRIVFGFVFLIFGLQKMFGLFGGQVAPLMSLMGAAGVIETVAGLLIMIGLFTRPAAFIASGEMAVAYFMSHFPKGVLPVENNGQKEAQSMLLILASIPIFFQSSVTNSSTPPEDRSSGNRIACGMRLGIGSRRSDSFLFTNTVIARSPMLLPRTCFRPIAKPLMQSHRSI